MLATAMTIFVIHGGGFVMGSPEQVQPIADDLCSRGYQAQAVSYPLNNARGAFEKVERKVRQARKRGPVMVYGISSGGTLAAMLAVQGKVDGAVLVAAPSDLLKWRANIPYWTSRQHWRDAGLARRRHRRQLSPARHVTRRAAPILMFHSRGDVVVSYDHSLRLMRAVRPVQRDVKLVMMDKSVGHAFPDRYHQIARVWINNRS